MKIKQWLSINQPASFFRGDYTQCFALYHKSMPIEDWLEVGEIEIEVPDEFVEKSQAAAIEALEAAEQSVKDEYTKDMIRIETARAELLCLTDQSAV